MAAIKVNHGAIKKAAIAVKEYCELYSAELGKASEDVDILVQKQWVGTDAESFRQSWTARYGEGSAAVKLLETMTAYGEGLDKCAALYQKAQADAFDRARALLK